MKRVLMLCILLLALAGCALAETREYEKDGKPVLIVENFEGQLSQTAQEIFGPLLREGDEVLSGTDYYELQASHEGDALEGHATLAVRREGKILLMDAYRENDWFARVETDDFFAGSETFSIKTEMAGSQYSEANLVIDCGEEKFTLGFYKSSSLCISKYERNDEGGGGIEIKCYPGEFYWRAKTGDDLEFWSSEQGIVPNRLAAWTYETFPRSEEEIHGWIKAHPLGLDSDEGYMSGVNFREGPTGESKSWGKYTAKVTILGSKPGLQVPWYNVRVGNVTGWCSGLYLHRAEDQGTYEVYTAAAAMQKVGSARQQTALYDAPGGTAVQTIEAGAFVHVLGERDRWLHVIIPRGELTWETDWDGTYGFVKAGDMAVGVSRADALWR